MTQLLKKVNSVKSMFSLRLQNREQNRPCHLLTHAFAGHVIEAEVLAGARTAMIGAVGGDAFGEALLQNLQHYGVDASHVVIHKLAKSGISVAITDAGGDYGAVIVSAFT